MTLLSTIQNLRTQAEVANDGHKVKERTGQFAEFSDRLRLSLAQLPGLNVGLSEVALLDSELPSRCSQNAIQVVENLRALAVDLPAVGVEQSLDLAKVHVLSAKRYVDELRDLVASTWQTYVSQPPPAVNGDLVDALAKGGVDIDEIREALESARGRLFAISNRPIPDHGAVERFHDAIESIHRCGEQLGEVVDTDIAEGIVGAQELCGMPLEWFTPARLEKLTALGIIDRFKVRLQ